jgi:hypothetical protein
MKRVKVMFTAMAVLAIVGSTVAFKSVKGSGNRYCSTSPNVTAPASADFNANPSGNLDRYCTTVSQGTTGSSTIKVVQIQ